MRRLDLVGGWFGLGYVVRHRVGDLHGILGPLVVLVCQLLALLGSPVATSDDAAAEDANADDDGNDDTGGQQERFEKSREVRGAVDCARWLRGIVGGRAQSFAATETRIRGGTVATRITRGNSICAQRDIA